MFDLLTENRKRWRRASSAMRHAGLVVALGFVAAVTSPVFAQAPPEATKVEARDHFDRGLRLFNQLDNEGALAEFTRAHELVPHVLVLQNIGLVYAAMGRPVQAQEIFERLLANPVGLDASTLERIRIERDRQATQIAEVEIVANVPNARVEVDGIEAARGVLRLAKGNHVIAVIGPGYVPLRKQLNLAGAARTRVEFDLLPTDAVLAHIRVRSRIPKLDLYLDGEFVGQTPLPASLAIAPGQRRLESKRAGYRTTLQTVNLGPGSSGALDINPEIDTNVLAAEGGELALKISEPGTIVFIDGESRGPYTAPLRLVAGEHLLRVEHAEFFPVERRVSVVARRRADYTLELKPTPEKLERYRSATARRSAWGWATTGTGSLLAAGGIGFLIWNAAEKSDKKAAFDIQVARAQPAGDCDPKGIQDATCRTELQLALDNLEKARDRDVYGWVGLGVGGAALGLGLYLLLGNDDPNRYSPKPQSDVFGQLRWTPTAWVGRGATCAGLVGSF